LEQERRSSVSVDSLSETDEKKTARKKRWRQETHPLNGTEKKKTAQESETAHQKILLKVGKHFTVN